MAKIDENIKVVMLKGEKGDAEYDDTELRGLISAETQQRRDNDIELNSAVTTVNNRVNQLVAPTGEAPNPSEITDARVGIDGTVYPNLGTAIRTQVNHLNKGLNDYQTKLNFVEFKNYVGEEAFEENKYWTTSANKIAKATGTNVALCPKIRIKANTRYSIRRVTNGFCYLGTDDDVLISKLSEYDGYTSFSYGDETCYSLITDTDCWLYMTYQTNLDYKTITVVEGKLPAKYYGYGVAFRREINGVPIGGAWHEKIVVDKDGTGDYKDLSTAMKYVTDGDALHWTDIILKDGEHTITEEITLPDYCCIIGESGNRDKCIVNFVPKDTSDHAIRTYSAFRMEKNSVLKNFTIKAINCRYCVHSDSSNEVKDWVQTLKNMKIEHLTNTSGSWESQNAWGGGASSGCLLTATDCVFIAHSAKAYAFSVHNNSNFEKPFRHVFSKCEFYSENYGCFKCEGLTSSTDDIVYCENCYFSAPIYLTNSLSIKMICSGCNLQQCNSTNYFAPNSIAEFREATKKLKNTSGSKIEKGTLVAYDNGGSQVRPMTEADDASIYAGFTIGDTEPNEVCTVIADGYYRYTDDLAFGTKYGVSNGKPSKTADNKVGICVGGGFIHLTARY